MARRRLPLSLVVFFALAAACAASDRASSASRPALVFFSSTTEQPLARLEARAVAPRFQNHGPFRVPAPGLAVESPSLALFAEPCAPDDWTRLLRELAAWRRLPVKSEPFEITLPDGRVFAFVRGPDIADAQLTGTLRPLAADSDDAASWLLLRIRHDGDRALVLDLRPAPARAASLPAPAPEATFQQ